MERERAARLIRVLCRSEEGLSGEARGSQSWVRVGGLWQVGGGTGTTATSSGRVKNHHWSDGETQEANQKQASPVAPLQPPSIPPLGSPVSRNELAAAGKQKWGYQSPRHSMPCQREEREVKQLNSQDYLRGTKMNCLGNFRHDSTALGLVVSQGSVDEHTV